MDDEKVPLLYSQLESMDEAKVLLLYSLAGKDGGAFFVFHADFVLVHAQ